MNDDGLSRGARLVELMAKHLRLDVARRMIVVIVESNFAPGDHARMSRQPVQFRVVRVGRVPGLVRMNPHRRVDPIVLLGIRNGRSKLFDFRPVADRQQRPDSRCPRALEHRFAVRVKVGNIHVRV